MKINKKCKIELIASKDETRSAINDPYLDGNLLVATDGRKMVVLTVELEEGDTDGYISKEALIQARKLAIKNNPSIISAKQESLRLANGTILQRKSDTQFPKWKQVIPEKNDNRKEISFNAKFLWEMAQSMGAENVKISILDEKSPLIIYPLLFDNPGSKDYGVLMPVCKIK